MRKIKPVYRTYGDGNCWQYGLRIESPKVGVTTLEDFPSGKCGTNTLWMYKRPPPPRPRKDQKPDVPKPYGPIAPATTRPLLPRWFFPALTGLASCALGYLVTRCLL